MKNIIAITSLLAAGTMFASADDVTKIDFTNASSSITLADFTGNSVTVVALLDVEALEAVMLKGAALSKHHLVELSGTLTSKEIGVTTNYSSGGTGKIVTSGIYGVGGTTENFDFGMGTGFEESSFWDGVSLASIALTTSTVSNFGTVAVLSLLQDGIVKTYGGTVVSGLRFGSQVFNTLTIDNDIVLSGYVQNSQVSVDELKSLGAAAIPEPSAFGLLAGVGALAFVAARRRRRAK